jgi:hypothetical protein
MKIDIYPDAEVHYFVLQHLSDAVDVALTNCVKDGGTAVYGSIPVKSLGPSPQCSDYRAPYWT